MTPERWQQITDLNPEGASPWAKPQRRRQPRDCSSARHLSGRAEVEI